MEQRFHSTVRACFWGYVVQAAVNTFVPLLLLTLQAQYALSLPRMALLVSFNFVLQLLSDLLSAPLTDRVGCRTAMVLAHGFAAAGLVSLTVLPECTGDPFVGLLLSVSLYAVGGGLLEVLVSPIVESCPTRHKEQTMSLLHSFYCWGQVGVVGLSTAFFALFGPENWKVLARLWAVLPLVNLVRFTYVPIPSLLPEGERGRTAGELLRSPRFRTLLVMMVCAGACEQAVAQWASAFAERGLGIPKALGDLLGPALFAAAMGCARTLYGRMGERWELGGFMLGSGALCTASYLLIALSPSPALGLVGCALCGLSVGILWPGTFSAAAGWVSGGGTAMYALLALAGDLGCAAGPALVGVFAGQAGDDLKTGFLSAVLFPLVLTEAIRRFRKAG